jgi:MSHA pilin protein MshD
MCTRPFRRQAGLTMVELIMFIIIISVAVADLMVTLGNLSARSADLFMRKQAMLRAESLLEEVSLAHFTFCHPTDANAETATSTGCAGLAETAGHPAGETRPYFNINDYVSAYGVPAKYTTDVTGAPMLPSNLSAQVTVKPVAAFGPSGALQIGAGGEVLHILVDVAYGDKGPNEHVKLERYRTRYAPNSMP